MKSRQEFINADKGEIHCTDCFSDGWREALRSLREITGEYPDDVLEQVGKFIDNELGESK